MQYRADAPFNIVVEMNILVFWIPAAAAFCAFVCLIALLKFRSNKYGAATKLAAGVVIVALAVPAVWLGLAHGAVTVMQSPKFSKYVECDPCF